MSWTEIIVYMIALNGVWMGFYASRNNEKLWKRVNFMQDVLIKNGVVGWKDFSIELARSGTRHNIKRGRSTHGMTGDYDKDDFDMNKLRRRVSELEDKLAEMKGEQHG